jgi:hypothetical protein
MGRTQALVTARSSGGQRDGIRGSNKDLPTIAAAEEEEEEEEEAGTELPGIEVMRLVDLMDDMVQGSVHGAW